MENKNYNEQIEHRKAILDRIRRGNRITPDDRLWLATHPIFNRSLGYPYLNADIISLQPNQTFLIRIEVEACSYPSRILPVLTVPGKKGAIIPSKLLMDRSGNLLSRKPVRMLGVLVDGDNQNAEVHYQSAFGLLGISFECEYYDCKQHLTIREDSNTGNPCFAMYCEKCADNKVLYKCKPPGLDNFESFCFSVEWFRLEEAREEN